MRICDGFVSRAGTAALMLGFGCYLILFLVTLFLPGLHGGDGFDGDMGGDFHDY
jgi:hypothetical protein